MAFSISINPNIRKSAYFDATVRDGVQSFSVYNHMYLPAHFGDPEAEYDRLLNGVAMWDVGAQRQVQLLGPDAGRLAQYLTPRNLSATKVGKGRYVPLCDYDGWLINDPVLLKLAEDRYWFSVADSDIHLWAAAIGRERGWDVSVSEPDVSPLAIQGPNAVDVAAALFGDTVRDFSYFEFREVSLGTIPLILARSGWSKQGGFELYLMDQRHGTELWDIVKSAGAPWGIGPGAPNDTERLESGLISYGSDMRRQDYPANPFEMGFGPLLDLTSDIEFVGRDALIRIASKPLARKRVGLIVEGTPPLPSNPVPLLRAGEEVGFVSEMAASRRVDETIAIGLIRADLADTASGLSVSIGPETFAARLHSLPFVK
ncbi:glycine cleavage T C-terminal barrel domain-containing protein [Algicella marina]|uniref:Glycine cleavage system protein T n=1 Tax=Algicella marina TaxID=2683284 RepID=A0A6P1T4E6_9RHOB|nr:glycine cleavage T C-terminal barrel domain-containing protein [Algicella marina]QHQ36129.1 glycine cleavage system protein T [Algicella marina]